MLPYTFGGNFQQT